jgi:hypothetical protein
MIEVNWRVAFIDYIQSTNYSPASTLKAQKLLPS